MLIWSADSNQLLSKKNLLFLNDLFVYLGHALQEGATEAGHVPGHVLAADPEDAGQEAEVVAWTDVHEADHLASLTPDPDPHPTEVQDLHMMIRFSRLADEKQFETSTVSNSSSSQRLIAAFSKCQKVKITSFLSF